VPPFLGWHAGIVNDYGTYLPRGRNCQGKSRQRNVDSRMNFEPRRHVPRNRERVALGGRTWVPGDDITFFLGGRIRIDVPSSVQCSAYLEDNIETLLRRCLIKGVSYWSRFSNPRGRWKTLHRASDRRALGDPCRVPQPSLHICHTASGCYLNR